MMFPPVLLFSSYLNLSNYKTDSAGLTAAWSGLYALLAMRRRQVCSGSLYLCPKHAALVYATWKCLGRFQWLTKTTHQGIKNKLTVRGVVRGGSLALCAVNVVGCGLAYTFGKREKEEKTV
jgi:hypothetical protein